MKIRLALVLMVFALSSFSFNHTNNQTKSGYNIKFIHTLKDKKGNLLGKLYVEDFKNDVFRKLLITKTEKGKTDTLYFINDWVFTNPRGIDIQFDKKNFHGYKIEHLTNDFIQLFSIGKSSAEASDPVIIEWNYHKKIFEVLQAP
ncbi:hypothetical protein G7092_10865 [Mucilaginibacter sp. HC2]|uniref:hypothetical protein n=1 Tax=Mucilaginibacter inviolabilis TaxID=2714892 RepID=UPI00140D651E|nr:hypothetical protein [Mucilaginibacter inviolabilis]NHA04301.1 hypothetical protein [Mucilaginibacter inviolabilis]